VLYGTLSLPPGKVQRLAEELMKILVGRKNPLLIRAPRVEFFTPGPGRGLPPVASPREGGPE